MANGSTERGGVMGVVCWRLATAFTGQAISCYRILNLVEAHLYNGRKMVMCLMSVLMEYVDLFLP